MCGIIGYQPIDPQPEALMAFGQLFDESRVRGTHAYGIAAVGAGYGNLRNEDSNISLFRTFDAAAIPPAFSPRYPTIAHTRYCQSGDWQVMENNQPLVVGDMALAMNGVIHMGTKAEYEAEFGVTCLVDNDSEVFLQKLVRGVDPEDFIRSITGSFAATWLKDGRVWAGRNERRPLWMCKAHGALWYASTADIFQRAGFENMEPLAPNVVWRS